MTNEAASNGTISTLVITIVFSSIYDAVCVVYIDGVCVVYITQSKKDKQNKRLSVEESVSTTEVRPKKRKKQNKPKSVHFPFDEKRLIVRCAISNVTKFIQNLSSSQRKAVAEMGFQEILCLQLNSIPSAFAYWLLRNYNPQTDSINDGEREIHLSSSLIQEVFNFPNRGTKVTVKTRPNTNDPVVKEWRS
ncbi:hypothetical protein R6Q57_017658 [Mikania cordata]